jgi:Histidine kinase-, DNA gyrase B-, and HSP90-like ATPase
MENDGIIKVADVTLAHLSRGLYRSTATTFKELVSNAFDADATEVRIDTNFPEFDFITCSDNGIGMSKETFMRHFNDKGIGSSTKRKGEQLFTPIQKRPIIGRLGIGMLAIGQLCHSFEIESHYSENGEGKAYHAVIVLEDVSIKTVEELEKDPGFIHGDLEVGTWSLNDIDYEKEKQGLTIITSDVRATFRREMKQSLDKNGKSLIDRIRFSQRKIHEEFFNNTEKTIRNWNAYLETIWELSILCPLPYYEDEDYSCPINFDKIFEQNNEVKIFIEQKQKQLKDYNFRVNFDGIELKRLIVLPSDSDKNINPEVHLIDYDHIVYDRKLRFRGYLFGQISKAIVPLELNGLQIRLKEVGIGGYDRTFLKYQEQIETIRSKWVSGEIFVEEGLEAALTINRDGFNEHEEHYKKLQNEIHKHLKPFFSVISLSAQKNSADKKSLQTLSLQSTIVKLIEEQTNKDFIVEEVSLPEDKETIIVNPSTKKITINIAHKNIKKEKADALYKTILAAFEVSKQMNNELEQKNFFETTLKKILQKLV